MKLDIISSRFVYFTISGVLFVVSLLFILFWTLNLWIDMTWGSQNEFSYETYNLDIASASQIAQTQKDIINQSWNIMNTVNVYKITGENTFVVEAWISNTLSDIESEEYKIVFRDNLKTEYAKLWDITLSRYTNIWASFWDYIRNSAKLTLIIAIGAIALYIAYTFSGTVWGITSLSFAAITIITLFHDVVIASGIYILTSYFFPQFQIDTFFVTALLTILGYSINDTIVIFDRIRSNLQEFGWKWKQLSEIINLSVNETMTRSIYTSLTIAFVLLCIIVIWPESITGFTLTMLYGTIIGTFSSIFIASPLLYEFHKKTILTVYEKKADRTDDDKMVV